VIGRAQKKWVKLLGIMSGIGWEDSCVLVRLNIVQLKRTPHLEVRLQEKITMCKNSRSTKKDL
jgi:hypothetical protein